MRSELNRFVICVLRCVAYGNLGFPDKPDVDRVRRSGGPRFAESASRLAVTCGAEAIAPHRSARNTHRSYRRDMLQLCSLWHFYGIGVFRGAEESRLEMTPDDRPIAFASLPASLVPGWGNEDAENRRGRSRSVPPAPGAAFASSALCEHHRLAHL